MAAAKALACPLWSRLACVQRSKASGERAEVVQIGCDDAAPCLLVCVVAVQAREVAVERVHDLNLHLCMTTPTGSGPLSVGS